MKRILLALLVFSQLTTIAQTLQASLGAGTTSKRLKVLVKSSAAVASTNISTLQFNLGVLTSIDPKPTITVFPNNTNFPSVTWQISETTEGGYYNFSLTTPSAPIIVTSLNTTNAVEVMEVEFSTDVIPLSVALVTLPDGGSGNVLFQSTGTPTSNGSSLYFQNDGVVVTNAFSYDLVNGLSGTTLSTAVYTGVVLPVKLLSFYAIKSGDDAKLSWTVGSDNENKYFDIERSTNARSYTTFARVNAYENGNSTNTYEAADMLISKLGSKDLYYRIKQVDKSGVSVYSVIRNLNVNQSILGISLYPNPARSITKLLVDAPAASKALIILRDFSGKQIQVINAQFVKGTNQKDLNVGNLPSGDYNVTVTSESLNQTIKLSKLN